MRLREVHDPGSSDVVVGCIIKTVPSESCLQFLRDARDIYLHPKFAILLSLRLRWIRVSKLTVEKAAIPAGEMLFPS